MQLTLAPVEVASMVVACRSMMLAAAAKRGITLEEDQGLEPLTVMADVTRIKQVLTNLISNAVTYNREGGQVRLSACRVEDGSVEIAVTDTGLGMSPDQLEALLQPYNRPGREAGNIEGTGLGLVNSRHPTELMGGTQEVRSQVGEGSLFTIRLPGPLP